MRRKTSLGRGWTTALTGVTWASRGRGPGWAGLERLGRAGAGCSGLDRIPPERMPPERRQLDEERLRHHIEQDLRRHLVPAES